MPEWKYSPDDRLLRRGDIRVSLTPKAAAVLDCLLSRPGEIVSRDDLLETVWPGLHVTPDLVREYIHDLRVALGDDAQKPRFIRTERGRGFRYLGGILTPERRDQGAGSAREVRVTLAVLPPLVQAPEWSEVAEAIATDLINELGRYGDIFVVARMSSFSVDMRQDAGVIAGRLGADYLLDSTFDCAGGILRMRLQLVEGETGRAIWSDTQEHPALEPGIARATIVASVASALSGWHGALHVAQFKSASARATGNLNAFEHFIRGCDIHLEPNEPGLMRSIGHFRRSLALDSRFARCWTMKSVMLRWAYDVVACPSSDMLIEADEAIERAHSLDPHDPVTLALVALKWAGEGDLARAKDAARRAARTGRSDADACFAVASPLAFVVGDLKAAGQALDRALSLSPVHPGYHTIVETRIAFFLDDHDRVIAVSRRGFEHVSNLAFRALSFVMLDRVDAATATMREIEGRFPRFNLVGYADRFPILHPAARHRFDRALDRFRRALYPEIPFALVDPQHLTGSGGDHA